MKIILLMIVTTLILTGCSKEEVAMEKIPIVKVQRASETNTNFESIFSGVVKGRYETNLAFQVGGQIMSRNVEVGNFVKAGDVLMTINPRDVVQQTNQAEAQVSSAKAQLDLATSNLNRYRELFKEGAIAASVLDQYQTSYDSALANYENVLAAAAQSQNALDYTNLVADFDGVISAINVESGQVVAAGQTVAVLVQTNELEVAVDIPESKISEIVLNQPVTVTFWAMSDSVEGFVREIAPMADPSSRTFNVKIAIPTALDKIQLGMTASVMISDKIINKEIVLPLSSIYQTGDKTQVWIVSDDKVHLQDVTVKNFDGNDVLVEGLNNDDIVVTAGIHKLREGQRVRLE